MLAQYPLLHTVFKSSNLLEPNTDTTQVQTAMTRTPGAPAGHQNQSGAPNRDDNYLIVQSIARATTITTSKLPQH